MNIVTQEEKIKFDKSMARISRLIQLDMEKDSLLSGIKLEQVAFALDIGKEFLYYDYPYHEENTDILNDALANNEVLSGKDFEIANKYYSQFTTGKHGYVYFSYEYDINSSKFLMYDSSDNIGLDKTTLMQFLPIIHCAVKSETNFLDEVLERQGQGNPHRLLVLYKWPKQINPDPSNEFSNPRSNILICTFSLHNDPINVTSELVDRLHEVTMDMLLEDVLMNPVSKKFASELLTQAHRAKTLNNFSALNPEERKTLYSLIKAKTHFSKNIVMLENKPFSVREMVLGYGNIDQMLESEISNLIKDLLDKTKLNLVMQGHFEETILQDQLEKHELGQENRNLLDVSATEFILNILYIKDDLNYDGSHPVFLEPTTYQLDGFSHKCKVGYEGEIILRKKLIARRIVSWYNKKFGVSVQALTMKNVFCLMLFDNTCTYEKSFYKTSGETRVTYQYNINKSENAINPSNIFSYLGLSFKTVRLPSKNEEDGLPGNVEKKVYEIIVLNNEEDYSRYEEIAFWQNVGLFIPKMKYFLDSFTIPENLVQYGGEHKKIRHDGSFVTLEDFRKLLHTVKLANPDKYQYLLSAIKSAMIQIDSRLLKAFEYLEFNLG